MCLKVSFFCEDTCKALGFTLDQQGRCVVADKPELLFLHRVVCVCVCGPFWVFFQVELSSPSTVALVSSNSPETFTGS